MGTKYTKPLSVTNSLQHMLPREDLLAVFVNEVVHKEMKESDYPLDVWDYCVERRSRIKNLISNSTFILHRANAYTLLTGKEGGFSNFF